MYTAGSWSSGRSPWQTVRRSPTVVLLLPTVTSLPTEAAQLIAGGWIALQFSFLGVDVARLSGRRPTLDPDVTS